MNRKYERYINYIVSDIKPPFFKDANSGYGYGLSEKEFEMVLSKVYNQPVTIDDNSVYNNRGNKIYFENSVGDWIKRGYDDQGNRIYYEDSDGYWRKWEYDDQGNEIYYEDSDDFWRKSEYDGQGNLIYFEDSDGDIRDNR